MMVIRSLIGRRKGFNVKVHQNEITYDNKERE